MLAEHPIGGEFNPLLSHSVSRAPHWRRVQSAVESFCQQSTPLAASSIRCRVILSAEHPIGGEFNPLSSHSFSRAPHWRRVQSAVESFCQQSTPLAASSIRCRVILSAEHPIGGEFNPLSSHSVSRAPHWRRVQSAVESFCQQSTPLAASSIRCRVILSAEHPIGGEFNLLSSHSVSRAPHWRRVQSAVESFCQQSTPLAASSIRC
ncbi:hypothetical protein ACOMHN_063785 [Nucella lapillus]